jgi:hypothetical protein
MCRIFIDATFADLPPEAAHSIKREQPSFQPERTRFHPELPDNR